MHVPGVSYKMTYFQDHGAQIDTLFIGSSRIYHGISPKVFDAVMSAAGQTTHSFNLAANDMKPPESLEMVHQVLRQHPVRRIILEWNPLQIDPHRADQTTRRDVYWHNTRWTWAILREVHGGRSRHLYSGHSVKLWGTHLSLWSQNFVNLGRGCDQIPSRGCHPTVAEDLGPRI